MFSESDQFQESLNWVSLASSTFLVISPNYRQGVRGVLFMSAVSFSKVSLEKSTNAHFARSFYYVFQDTPMVALGLAVDMSCFLR
jgi:hypothetical protein